MARFFEAEKQLRLSDDYPDLQKQPLNMPLSQPQSGPSSQFRLDARNDFTLHSGPSTSFVFASRATEEQERAIRRRSSKACDNCRKAKCKCEPSETSEQGCRNCELLGLPCTFLGPSRKRGPPKGYIEAIEARLHQLEAIVGSLLTAASDDPRSRSILEDLSGNRLAADAIARVRNGAFGPGFAHSASEDEDDDMGVSQSGGGPKKLANSKSGRKVPSAAKVNITMPDDPTIIDPIQWRDQLVSALTSNVPRTSDDRGGAPLPTHDRVVKRESPPSHQIRTKNPRRRSISPGSMDARHVRTRVDAVPPALSSSNGSSPPNQNDIVFTPDSDVEEQSRSTAMAAGRLRDRTSDKTSDNDTSESEEALALGIGALSIDDALDVRYHGKTSGLHLLVRRKAKLPAESQPQTMEPVLESRSREGSADDGSSAPRSAARERGGLWHFPPPGVWPPIDNSMTHRSKPQQRPSVQIPEQAVTVPKGIDQKNSTSPSVPFYVEQQVTTTVLPDIKVQQQLIDLYFSHVHPVLPIIDCAQFLDSWQVFVRFSHLMETAKDVVSPETDKASEPISLPILLCVLALGSRYCDPGPDLPHGKLWTAGLDYASEARHILIAGKMPSRASTVQALILLSYLDVGVGAMASAWHASGLAVRTALDVGLNRPVDEWRSPDGGKFFDKRKAENCRRIWYGVLLIDNYVATYIGRPLALDDHDYDTPFPTDDPEDSRMWHIPSSDFGPLSMFQRAPEKTRYESVPQQVIPAFRQRAQLSSIQGAILRQIYSVKPHHDRKALAGALDARLDKWYRDLPPDLEWRCPATMPCKPPHVVVLHMDYWCSVLLLHRPFIKSKPNTSQRKSEDSVDSNGSASAANARRALGLCETAANTLVVIGTTYAQNFSMARCPAWFTFYIFTASIMHVTILLENPLDMQATKHLDQSMQLLSSMSILWPSAGRALELLVGAKENIGEVLATKRGREPEQSRLSEDDRNSGGAQLPSHLVAPFSQYELNSSTDNISSASSMTATTEWSGPDHRSAAHLTSSHISLREIQQSNSGSVISAARVSYDTPLESAWTQRPPHFVLRKPYSGEPTPIPNSTHHSHVSDYTRERAYYTSNYHDASQNTHMDDNNQLPTNYLDTSHQSHYGYPPADDSIGVGSWGSFAPSPNPDLYSNPASLSMSLYHNPLDQPHRSLPTFIQSVNTSAHTMHRNALPQSHAPQTDSMLAYHSHFPNPAIENGIYGKEPYQ